MIYCNLQLPLCAMKGEKNILLEIGDYRSLNLETPKPMKQMHWNSHLPVNTYIVNAKSMFYRNKHLWMNKNQVGRIFQNCLMPFFMESFPRGMIRPAFVLRTFGSSLAASQMGALHTTALRWTQELGLKPSVNWCLDWSIQREWDISVAHSIELGFDHEKRVIRVIRPIKKW